MLQKIRWSCFGLVLLLNYTVSAGLKILDKQDHQKVNNTANTNTNHLLCCNQSLLNVSNKLQINNSFNLYNFEILSNKITSWSNQSTNGIKLKRQSNSQPPRIINNLTVLQKNNSNLTYIYEDRNFLFPFCSSLRCEISEELLLTTTFQAWNCMTQGSVSLY